MIYCAYCVEKEAMLTQEYKYGVIFTSVIGGILLGILMVILTVLVVRCCSKKTITGLKRENRKLKGDKKIEGCRYRMEAVKDCVKTIEFLEDNVKESDDGNSGLKDFIHAKLKDIFKHADEVLQTLRTQPDSADREDFEAIQKAIDDFKGSFKGSLGKYVQK